MEIKSVELDIVVTDHEFFNVRKVKLEYFNSGWNVMDLCVICVSLFNIGVAIYTEVVVGNLLKVRKVR